MVRHVVIIGPVSVGKSTIGPSLAALLGVPFVDLDEVAADHYAEVGQGIDRLIERARSHGFVEAHRWWQPARAHAVRSVLRNSTVSVVAFGAGHSHFEDEQWFAELPEVDIDASVAVLRQRCVDERGEDQDWLYGHVDFIRDWVVSGQNRCLADTVVYTEGRPVDAIALDIAVRVQK